MAKKWKTEDNKTLIDLHGICSFNRILYRKAGNLFKRFNKLMGVIGMISSSIGLSVVWINSNNNDNLEFIFNDVNNISISDICNEDTNLLKTLLSFSLITIFSQNIFNFSDIATDYFKISKLYGNIQYDVEFIGDIHPKKRNGEPKYLLPKLRHRTNKLNQNSKEISSIISTLLCFSRNNNIKSYLSEKHERYNNENVSDDEDIDDHYSFDRIHNRDNNVHIEEITIDN
jgi:hypothetical protein